MTYKPPDFSVHFVVLDIGLPDGTLVAVPDTRLGHYDVRTGEVVVDKDKAPSIVVIHLDDQKEE